MEFKIGDKVRRFGWSNRWGDGRVLAVGTECVVTGIDDDYIEVEVDGVKYAKNDPEWFELVSEEDNAETIEIDNTEEDVVNHPNHYTREGAMETIDEMILVFGVEAVKHFCLCNAWKYRARALNKNKEEDLAKSDAYLRYYKQLEETGSAKF